MIESRNLITSSDPRAQEIASFEKILSDYQEGNYNNMYILIMYYIGHVNHYCGHEGMVQRLLNLFTYNLEYRDENRKDSFVDFVERRLEKLRSDSIL